MPTTDLDKGCSIERCRFLVDGRPVTFAKFCDTLIQRNSQFALDGYEHLPEVRDLADKCDKVWLPF